MLLALGSAAEMTLLALATNVPYDADATRLYYGTDTHSMGLLLGAALAALAVARDRPRPGNAGRPRRRFVGLTDVLAAAALVALAVAACTVPEWNRTLYRGGFLAVAAVAAVAVAAIARPGQSSGAGAGPQAPSLAGGAVVRRLPLALAGRRRHPPGGGRALAGARWCWRCGSA